MGTRTQALVVTALAVVASAGAVALGDRPASAQAPGAETVEATVVRIDGEDILVDVGGARVASGTELSLYRAIEVRHPVSRRVLRDRFVIGRLRITQPGEALSIARLVGTSTRTVAVGDAAETQRAVAVVAPAAAAATCPPRQCPSCPACASDADPESAEIVAVWRASLGHPPEERIRLYRIFLERNPRSPHASAVRTELESLRGQVVQQLSPRRAAPGENQSGRVAALGGAVRAAPLEHAREGDPVEVAVTVDPEAAVEAVLLYVRGGSGRAYRRLPMQIQGQHARVRVPRGRVRPPGFEYFVEVVGEDGHAVSAIGSAGDPHRVTVETRGGTADALARSRVRFSTEVVSFNGFVGNDWYVLAEGDFLYRTLFHALYGVRVGYGHISGEGGTVRDLDELGLAPRAAGFTYGYLESELRLSDLFALMVRGTVGLGRPENASDEGGLRGGLSLRLRVGPEDGTNLVVAGETIPEIGQRAYLGLTWEAIEDWPMTAEVHVTDQPVNSDELAVRGVFEVGYRATDALALSGRFSYQGRTIDHAGLGAGLAATFDW